MAPAAAPNALTISIQEVLDLLDGQFAALATGIARRQYTFWLGSGISRERMDDLKKVVERVLEYLRERVDLADPTCPYQRALDEALGYAHLSPADRAAIDYAKPMDEWTPIDTVLQNLTQEYSRLLDIRINGHPEEDFLLWEVVDVPTTFAPATAVPDCEHFCLAVLVLEGVLPDVASANWDGLIEAAVDELTDHSGTALRVCVREDDLRDPPLLTRLLKFHGCAVRAGLDPATYRGMLIARRSQITDWRNNPDYAVMKHELLTLAATKPTLMIGLSAQDTNIQQVFSDGQALMHWRWPCSPPAHVFAEDQLGPDQINILRMVYRAAYGANRAAIETGALLRAYAKPILTALVLHLLCKKLGTLAQAADAPGLSLAERSLVEDGIMHLRNRVAAHGDADRLSFMRAIITGSARGMALFQGGSNPTTRTYRSIGTAPIHMIAADVNLPTSGLREMASAIGLLGLGDEENHWVVEAANAAQANAGALHLVTPSGPTRIFFAANDKAGVQLEINGIVTSAAADAIVIHSTSPVPTMVRSPRVAPGRTGRPGLRHIAMGELLREATSASELRRRFREEASL